jgi:hypothetical protein
MKNDAAMNTTFLSSINSSVGTLSSRFNDMHLMMSEAINKLALVQNSVPMSMGYCWGPEAPIQLLDGLDRKLYLPIMLVSSPDVSENTKFYTFLEVNTWSTGISRNSLNYTSRLSGVRQN